MNTRRSPQLANLANGVVAHVGWPNIEIGKLINGIEQGWSPLCEKDPAVSLEDWAVIKTTAIQPMQFLQFENKKLPKYLSEKPNLEINNNDILITRAGPRSRVAICCLVENIRLRLMLISLYTTPDHMASRQESCLHSMS